MKVICPQCHQEITPANINVAADVAFCPECHEAFRLSEFVGSSGYQVHQEEEPVPKLFDPSACPKKITYQPSEDQTVVTVKFRKGGLFFFAPLAGIFTLAAGAFLVSLFDGDLGVQEIVTSIWGLFLSLSTSLLTCYFIWGKTRFWINAEGIRLFDGLGPFSKKEQYSWSDIEFFTESENEGSYSIGFEGTTRKNLLSNLTDEQAYYLYQTFRLCQQEYSP
jgi:hypothetical protein